MENTARKGPGNRSPALSLRQIQNELIYNPQLLLGSPFQHTGNRCSQDLAFHDSASSLLRLCLHVSCGHPSRFSTRRSVDVSFMCSSIPILSTTLHFGLLFRRGPATMEPAPCCLSLLGITCLSRVCQRGRGFLFCRGLDGIHQGEKPRCDLPRSGKN